MNISYIDMCKLKEKNPKNEERNKREGLVVVVVVCMCVCVCVCVVVHLVNHLDNKKPFRTL
jgi:hypothetical protein